MNKGKYRPRHSDHPYQAGGPLDPTTPFKPLGWYMIIGWTEPCPECGVRRSGTPGTYQHWIRENTDDEARMREVHGGPDTRGEDQCR